MSYINKKASEKLWAYREGIGTDSGEGAAVARELGFSEAFGRLLSLRGYKTAEEATAFLRVEDGYLHDPFLLTDMDKAVKVVEDALADNVPITIYGDYDVDGVTSVSILQLYLEGRGASVSHYIPDRLGEGYGMSRSAIERMAADGVGLIITVDTGITA
ncbi:MAG: single-stranded-DNA-specific exonuclease RecJ, partial [Clostridia bacterium]|nr:single-stranded-DNA-specific exonuclease RecJ [Clostridia bacterium]